MTRTHALFGLAASLLVTAAAIEYFWNDGDADSPPPAPPPPVQNTPQARPGPVARVDVAGLIRVQAALANGYLPSSTADDTYVRIQLDAAKAAQGARPPMALAVVIDRSGSMDGEKMSRTRDAAKRLVDRLADDDQLTIVSYATDHQIDLPLQTIGAAGRTRIKRIIDRLYVGGGTNLSSGMNAALRQLRSRDAVHGVRRVVLMSDGNANQGQTNPAYLARVVRRARGQGVTLSSLGVGLDFNEDLMTLLADSGGGAYYYARDGAAVSRALQAEFEGMASLAARGVEIELELGEHFALGQVYGYELSRRDGRVVVPVGDMTQGGHRQILVRLSRHTNSAGTIPVVRTTLRYQAGARAGTPVTTREIGQLTAQITDDAATLTAGRQADVQEAIAVVLSAQARQEAAANFARGRGQAARQILRRQVAKTKAAAKRLKSPALRRQAKGLMNALDTMGTADAYSDEGKDLIKSEKSRARSLYLH